MKSYIVKFSIALSVVTLMLFATSCNKEAQRTGRITVKMKDAPIDFDSVNIEVLEVEVHYSTGGWTTLSTNSGVYNLLDLQNDVTAVLVDSNALPVGDIQQMRLILGTNNHVVVDSIAYPLELSSQANTGLKFNLNTSITPNDLVEILIDFDAQKSIVLTGSGVYKLKPVIKVEDIIYY